jgi:arylformamidase
VIFGRIIDLSVPLGERTIVYPGDTPFSVRWTSRIPEAVCNVSAIESTPHLGTHVDAPLHFLSGGDSIAAIPLERFIGDAVCIDAPKDPGSDVATADIRGADIRKGDIVIFRTGWEKRIAGGTQFRDEWPGFDSRLVEELASMGVKAIGVDSPSADSPRAFSAGAAAHRTAAANGVPIFECLVNLSEIAGKRFTFIALPLRLEACEASPVRAVAVLPE